MYNRYITQQKEKNVTGKQKLKATIGLPQAIALNIGAVLGSGILLMPGVSAQLSGPASLIAWGVMALFVLPMALSMGLLSSAYPNSAGVSHFATLAFGRKIGALVGWFFLMSVTIGGPIVAIIGAEYLGTMLGLGKVGVFWLSVLILLLGLGINFIGMKIAGQIQIAVMISILVVLITSIAGSVPHMDATNLTPFLPHGWISVGQTMALLFWCFIGWEAVSHLTEEFKNPEKDAIRSVWIAAILVGVLYFLTALATVATHSFSERETNASLVILVYKTFGTFGGWVIGFTAVFICIATLISYISAASRLAYALSRQQEAPKWMGRITEANGVPVGGLVFLTLFFILVIGHLWNRDPFIDDIHATSKCHLYPDLSRRLCSRNQTIKESSPGQKYEPYFFCVNCYCSSFCGMGDSLPTGNYNPLLFDCTSENVQRKNCPWQT